MKQAVKNNPESQSYSKLQWYYISAALTLVLATILAYLPSLHYPFQFDDLGSIVHYFGIRNQTFHDLFFSGSRWISYWLNTVYYSIGAFDPFSYRVGNLIIHIGNGLLIFFTLLMALKATAPKSTSPNSTALKPISLTNLISTSWFSANAFYISITTSLLFLLHPVQTQTVSYVIQGQLEGLATLCILSMVLCLIFFVHAQSWFGKMSSATALCLSAALSTGTKEIAIISPLLLLLVDWFFLARLRAKSDKTVLEQHNNKSIKGLAKTDSLDEDETKTTKNKRRNAATEFDIPGNVISNIRSRLWLYALITAIVITCYLYFLKPAFFIEIFGFHKVIRNNTGNVVTQDPHQMIGPWIYCISEFKAIVHYLWMFIWPFNISVEYDDALCRSFFAFNCLAPLALLITLATATLALLRKNSKNPVAFGMLWFALCIAPRSTLIPSNELIVDYKTYLASFGLLLVITIALVFFIQALAYFLQVRFSRIQPRWAFIAGALMLATALGYATIQRNTVWSSGLMFWKNIVDNTPNKARVQNNYGVELSSSKNYKAAIKHFKKAIALDKNYADPYVNLASIFSRHKRYDEAIICAKKSITIDPRCDTSYHSLSVSYIQKKKYALAEKYAQQALAISPRYGEAYGDLARIYLDQNKPEIAWGYLKKACTQASLDTPVGFNAFAQVSMRLKKYDDAIWAFNKLLALNPLFPEAQINVANAYFLSNQFVQAEEQYKKLLNGSAFDAFIYYNLGKAAFGQKQYAKALSYYEHIPSNHPQIKDTQKLIKACSSAIAVA
jgi:tetratricopeptide (TPR) repeat protein